MNPVQERPPWPTLFWVFFRLNMAKSRRMEWISSKIWISGTEILAIIPQTIYLSDDTIRNNVAFGVYEDEINDEAVIESLKKSAAL